MSKAIARDYRPGTPAENRSNMIKFTKRSRRAFSLVEILFAVIIIGVLTAVAVPSLFNNKGKADDSNAKQTLRAAYTLISTSLDDSGALQATDAASLVTFLATVDKNLTFAPANAVNTGNVRTIGVGVATDVVTIAAIGGKTNTGKNCFGIVYDITGAAATKFVRVDSASPCTSALVNGATGAQSITGDFPLK